MLKAFPQNSESLEAFNISCTSHNHAESKGWDAEASLNCILVNLIFCHIGMNHSYWVFVRLNNFELPKEFWVFLDKLEGFTVSCSSILETYGENSTSNNIDITQSNCGIVNTIFQELLLELIFYSCNIILVYLWYYLRNLLGYPWFTCLNIIPHNQILA